MILKNKVVVVTGASDGIGRAIVQRLAGEGAKLALVAKDQQKLAVVARATNGKAFACDVRDSSQVESTVAAVVAQFDHIDVLINCAGIWQKVGQLDDINDDVISEVVATNLMGTINMVKHALPYMRVNKDESAIVNIVSKSGIVAQQGQSVYTASKYGVRGFTDVLRVDLQDTKIRIGAVYQSGINTQMFAKTGEDFPTEKFTEPTDLADAVAYMLTRPPKMWMPELHVVY